MSIKFLQTRRFKGAINCTISGAIETMVPQKVWFSFLFALSEIIYRFLYSSIQPSFDLFQLLRRPGKILIVNITVEHYS